MTFLLDFVYPSFCIYCDEKISFKHLFCLRCSHHLSLSDDLAIFENNPMTKRLIEYAKKYPHKRLLKSIAAYTSIKYYQIRDTPPICISSSKDPFTRQIAKQTAKYLQKPYKKEKKALNYTIYFQLDVNKSLSLPILEDSKQDCF